MKRLTAALTLLLLALLIAPETARTTPAIEQGYASAYDDGVMDAVIRYRLDNDVWRTPPPLDWYASHGAIATNDCTQVGSMRTLIDPAGREYRVLVADCGGDDGGAAWMTAHGIIAELDWQLWQRLTEQHGKPLSVGLK